MGGTCQPCAFVRKRGCNNGANCQFCHICGPEVRRRRQLARLDQKRREYRLKKKMKVQVKGQAQESRADIGYQSNSSGSQSLVSGWRYIGGTANADSMFDL